MARRSSSASLLAGPKAEEEGVFQRMRLGWAGGVGVYAALYYLQRWAFRRAADAMAGGPARMHLMRWAQVIDITILSVPFSAFLLHRFRAMVRPVPAQLLSLPPDTKAPHNSVLQSAAVRKVGLPLTWFLVLASHSMYLLYFTQGLVPVWLSFPLVATMGVWLYLVGFLVAFSLLNFAFRIFSSVKAGKALLRPLFSVEAVRLGLTDPPTQTALAYLLAFGFAQVSLVSALVLRTPTVPVHLHRLHPSLRGFRVAVLSDVHTGPSISAWQLGRMVEATNELRPDLVAVVGDLEDGAWGELSGRLEVLRRLRSTHGTVFVTGNHEYYYGDLSEWIAGLKSWGITVLQNEAMRLPPNEPKLCVLGLNDVSADRHRLPGGNMSVRAAAKACAPHDSTLLLQHNPAAAPGIVASSPIDLDLILSGHVHAGQIWILALPMWLELTYFHGLYHLPPKDPAKDFSTQLFVSGGVHYWAAPMKTFACSEIPLIVLS